MERYPVGLGASKGRWLAPGRRPHVKGRLLERSGGEHSAEAHIPAARVEPTLGSTQPGGARALVWCGVLQGTHRLLSM